MKIVELITSTVRGFIPGALIPGAQASLPAASLSYGRSGSGEFVWSNSPADAGRDACAPYAYHKENCRNCGAPPSGSGLQCAYCGSWYLDDPVPADLPAVSEFTNAGLNTAVAQAFAPSLQLQSLPLEFSPFLLMATLGTMALLLTRK